MCLCVWPGRRCIADGRIGGLRPHFASFSPKHLIQAPKQRILFESFCCFYFPLPDIKIYAERGYSLSSCIKHVILYNFSLHNTEGMQHDTRGNVLALQADRLGFQSWLSDSKLFVVG